MQGARIPGKPLLALLVALMAAGCSSDENHRAGSDEATGVEATTTDTAGELYPDVVAAEADREPDGTWTFRVTVSSPYDTPDRYADAWRIVGPDGTEYGIRELLHDHQGEQPFTRSLPGVEIPAEVTAVTIEGRDQRSGWGGRTVTIDLSAG